MKHVIRVEEILSRAILVEATNEDEAIQKVEDYYNDGKIVLDYDDFVPPAEYSNVTEEYQNFDCTSLMKLEDYE